MSKNTRTQLPGIPIGIVTNDPKFGELPQIVGVGSMRLPIKTRQVQDPPPEKTWSGSLLAVFVQAARDAGHPVPDRLLFTAGQLFYCNGQLEEVRLSGAIPEEKPGVKGRHRSTPWTTPTPPRLTRGPEGALILDLADRGRTHLSALVVKPWEMALFWDLSGNVPEEKGVSPSPELEVINSLLYQRLREVLAAAEFFTHKGETWPAADLSTDNHRLRAVAQLRPPPVDVEPYLTGEELAQWQERMAQNVMAMDDLTADVLDIISAVWLRQADHHEAMANVTANDFLRFRGVLPKKSGTGRRGGYEDEQRKEIARHIAILSNTWISVAEMEITELAEGKKGPYRKRAKWRGESRAVVVSSRFGQITLDGKLDPYAWRARPGDVFAKFLFGPGRQTALLSQKALEYDPYRQKMEKRLTRYLAWQWRNRQGTGDYLHPFAVETLLKAARETVDKKHPIRTKERLEKALDTLRRDGVIRAWQYEAAREEIVGQKGWWKTWLTWKVSIEPPQDVMDQYAKISMPAPKTSSPKALPPGPLDPAAVRQARLERGLTQMQAAEKIGIHQATLSRIERGARPDAPTLKKIQQWLTPED